MADGDQQAVRSHAKWVLHCLNDTHDFDYLPGDVRDAMKSMATTIVQLTEPQPPGNDRTSADRSSADV